MRGGSEFGKNANATSRFGSGARSQEDSWSRHLLSTQTGSAADVSCYIPLSNVRVMSRETRSTFIGSTSGQERGLFEIRSDQLEAQRNA